MAALLPFAGINAALPIWALLLSPNPRITTAYLSSLTLPHDSIHATKDKAVNIRNVAWISFWTSIISNENSSNFLHEVLATLSVKPCGSASLGVVVVVVCVMRLCSTSFWLLGSTLPFTLSRYFSWLLKSYCSFQCDVGSLLQRSNTENVKFLTNSAGERARNTHCKWRPRWRRQKSHRRQ